MTVSQDHSDQTIRAGYSGFSASTRNVANSRKGAPAGYMSEPVGVVSRDNDLLWALQSSNSRSPHTYFDYFFTGQDIQLYIDGVERPEFGATMPIMEFAFNISQQKTPVYGAFSYTYDTVMRGNRVINGAFRIATTHTGYMTDMIASAARARVERRTDTIIRGLDTDEANIEKYWQRTSLSDVSARGAHHIFSSHPPFNFVMMYGLQSTSLTNSLSGRQEEIYAHWGSDTPLMSDVNERLVKADPNGSMRIVLENVELTAMQTEVTPDGQVISESYQFFARDIRMPRSIGRTNSTHSVELLERVEDVFENILGI